MRQKYLSTSELAKILGISRVAVLKKIKLGQIKAERIGRNYAIKTADLSGILGEELTDQQKKEINLVVKKTVKEYGETLRLLGNS